VKRASAGQKLGRYRLEERLGLGGTAEVWKATLDGPQGFRRTVVLKRLLPELVADPAAVALLQAEARLSARLHHPAIVQVLELAELDGEWVLALEHVDGCDLRRLLRAQSEAGPPDPGLGAFVVHEVCRALAYAHALAGESGAPLEIIHRDVSPSNVMLSSAGAVKLVDFGLAKALAAADATRTGALKGNLAYMAPEQLAGRSLDARADLYAAGVVLHEALTARRLFKATDLASMAALRVVRIDPPSAANPRVPAELDAICRRALAPEPADRYASAGELAEALEPLVHRFGFGASELARLVQALPREQPAPAPVEASPARVTESHEAPKPPSPSPPRSRLPRAIAVVIASALLASLGWLALRARLRPPVPTTLPPIVATPAPPTENHGVADREPENRRPSPPRKSSSPSPKAKAAPNLVKGKLVDPFKR
jgi:serine/threonine-protein kinase